MSFMTEGFFFFKAVVRYDLLDGAIPPWNKVKNLSCTPYWLYDRVMDILYNKWHFALKGPRWEFTKFENGVSLLLGVHPY